jgi:hypothetical protein
MNFHLKSFPIAPTLLVQKTIALGLILLVTMISMMLPAQAMSDAHQQGMSLAQNIPIPQPGNLENIPGYRGTDLPQSQIKAHDLGEHSSKASQSDEASQLISENFEKGERFVIDPHTDPLILAGNEVIHNPQKTLDENFTEIEEGGKVTEETKTCEEGGEEYIQNCSKRLEITLKITPESKTTYYGCPGNHPFKERRGLHYRHWTDYCGGRNCTPYTSTTPKKVEIVSEEWVDGCAVLEDLAEKGLCRYISKSISPKNETRTIDGETITRDHFEEHFQYACLKTSTQSCAALRERGCYQVKSICKEQIDGRCVLWEQTYRCPSCKISGKSYRFSNKKNPFCLSGDCADKSYTTNSDFAQVMSHMSVLKEAGDDLKNLGTIFKGQDRRCTRHCVDFKDCCGNGRGWGVSLSLASCDQDEKELAELRNKNRCIQVGTYCAEKVLGVCIRKKTSFCCYGTKLAKIVQEQGKRQLGLGFGSPEHPECQGLTAEQLSRIDFSQINFSDIFSEVVGRTKTPNPEKLVSGIQKSMETKGSLLKPPVKGTKAGSSLTPTIQGTRSGKGSLASQEFPGSTPETTAQPEAIQVQGRSHGQF